MKLFVILFVLVSQSLFAQAKRDSVLIETSVFTVMYSETLEQPLWIKYRSINRPTNVNRGHMTFYKEKNVHTSDDADYKANLWDKGHGAPAATFSDNTENLKQTFSYLNSIMQDQYLNRGVWKILEGQEREWSKIDIVIVKIKLIFNNESVVLPTGATVPFAFEKSIFLLKSKKTYKFYFENIKPIKNVFWDYKID